jgi:MFS family permease
VHEQVQQGQQGQQGQEFPYSAGAMLAMLSFINFLNYLDRGIIPGAASEFSSFIASAPDAAGVGTFLLGGGEGEGEGGDATASTSALLGLLQSAFIGGYAVSAMGFGNLVHRCRPFPLMGVGLGGWALASALAGLARAAGSYRLLLAARVLSGVGEAAFQCIAPAFVDDTAPPARRTVWLGVLYTAIPVGAAVGYGYSATVSELCGWQWAFWLEAGLMLPFAAWCCFDSRLDAWSTAGGGGSEAQKQLADDHISASVAAPAPAAEAAAPSLRQEVAAVLHSRVYVLVLVGYCACTGAVAGFSSFGPQFLLQVHVRIVWHMECCWHLLARSPSRSSSHLHPSPSCCTPLPLTLLPVLLLPPPLLSLPAAPACCSCLLLLHPLLHPILHLRRAAGGPHHWPPLLRHGDRRLHHLRRLHLARRGGGHPSRGGAGRRLGPR